MCRTLGNNATQVARNISVKLFPKVELENVNLYCSTGSLPLFSGLFYYLEMCGVNAPPILNPMICGAVSTSSAECTWQEDQNDDLQGYGIQISTDGVNFVDHIANTFNKNEAYKIAGLPDNTLFYSQVRSVYLDGTFGPWSSMATFTTLEATSAVF